MLTSRRPQTSASPACRGGLFAAALLGAVLLWAPQGSAQEDIGTVYLNAYLTYEDAEKLEGQGQFAAALRKFNDAKNVFDTIARTHPDWRREVVTFRRRKTNEAVERVRVRVPGADAGVPLPYPQRTPVPPVPSTSTDASADLIKQKDEMIRHLRAESDNLLAKLQGTQRDLERTLQDLRTSQIARKTLSTSLEQTQAQLKAADLDPEAVKRLEADVKRLTNELAIANEALAAADKRNEKLDAELRAAKDMVASLQTERDELQKEREQMEDLLKGAKDSDVKRLLAENHSLKRELGKAKDEIKKLTGEKERDAAQIAALRERLAGVESKLADLQKENADYQKRIADLSSKLRSTEDNLKEALSSGSGDAKLAKAAMEENEALRNIVKRQIIQQAWRKKTKELVMAELMRNGNASRGMLEQIERLAGQGAVLTPDEQEFFRDSLLKGLGNDVGVLIEPGGEGGVVKYPELGEGNGGALNEIGLNENLTGYARAIAVDFARGEFATCEKGYAAVLERAPGNIYTMRNLGIVKMRLGKAAEAEDLFKRALAIDAGDDYSHYILGVLYYKSGRHSLAMQSIDRGLQIDPDNPKAHHYLGAICIKEGLRERARQEFQSVVAIDPSFGDAYYNLAYLYVTDSPPRLDLARDYYQRAQRNGTAPDAAMDQALGT